MRIAKHVMSAFALVVIASAGLALAGVHPAFGGGQKITICHAAGREGTTHYITLTISRNAVFGPGGHFNEDGTPQAGHEQDYMGPCRTDTTSTDTTTTTDTTTETTTTTETHCCETTTHCCDTTTTSPPDTTTTSPPETTTTSPDTTTSPPDSTTVSTETTETTTPVVPPKTKPPAPKPPVKQQPPKHHAKPKPKMPPLCPVGVTAANSPQEPCAVQGSG